MSSTSGSTVYERSIRGQSGSVCQYQLDDVAAARLVWVAIDNPDLSRTDLAERFGVGKCVVELILKRAGIDRPLTYRDADAAIAKAIDHAYRKICADENNRFAMAQIGGICRFSRSRQAAA